MELQKLVMWGDNQDFTTHQSERKKQCPPPLQTDGGVTEKDSEVTVKVSPSKTGRHDVND